MSGVDTEHVTAAYQNGVLTLEMPKKAEAAPESEAGNQVNQFTGVLPL